MKHSFIGQPRKHYGRVTCKSSWLIYSKIRKKNVYFLSIIESVNAKNRIKILNFCSKSNRLIKVIVSFTQKSKMYTLSDQADDILNDIYLKQCQQPKHYYKVWRKSFTARKCTRSCFP